MSKRMLFIFARAPYGTIYAQEALDILLVGAAYDQSVSVALIDDGVFQLKRGQNPAKSRMKQFTRAYGALDDFGVEEVLIESESLQLRGMNVSDLLEIRRDDGSSMTRIVSTSELTQIIECHEVVLQF